jgi:hypothetical protein
LAARLRNFRGWRGSSRDGRGDVFVHQVVPRPNCPHNLGQGFCPRPGLVPPFQQAQFLRERMIAEDIANPP